MDAAVDHQKCHVLFIASVKEDSLVVTQSPSKLKERMEVSCRRRMRITMGMNVINFFT